jgi:hypothetical protein
LCINPLLHRIPISHRRLPKNNPLPV